VTGKQLKQQIEQEAERRGYERGLLRGVFGEDNRDIKDVKAELKYLYSMGEISKEKYEEELKLSEEENEKQNAR